MLESIEIFEEFDFISFTLDPVTLKVQFKGSYGHELPLSLVRALASYCKQSKRDIVDAIRSMQHEGNIILLSESVLSSEKSRTMLMWRFNHSKRQVVGLLQRLGQDSSFSSGGFNLKDARTREDQILWNKELQRASGGNFEFVDGRVTASAADSPKDRLVHLNVALTGAQLGFWDWNKVNNLFAVSSQWTQHIGARQGSIRTVRDFFDLVHPEDREIIDRALFLYAQGKTRMYKARFRLFHKDGRYVHIEAVGAFQIKRNRFGHKEMHLVGIHRDRTEEVNREMALQTMVDNVKKEMEAKSRFLANVSHEIRTPVHGILNMVQFAKSYHTVEKQEAYLNAAMDSARALGFKLDGLVDFANLDHMPLIPSYSKARLMPILNLAKNYLWTALSSKSLSFKLDVDEPLQGVYDLDEKLLSQILMGLLDNAVKFTQEGEVSLKAKHLRRSSRPDQPGCFVDEVQFCISDTGLGMSDEQLQNAFLPFQQKRTERNRLHTGIGVGLNLVHSCVTALGGEVSIESELGFGTKITVNINLRGFETELQSVDSNAWTSQKEIRKVLVVDDSRLNRMIIRAELEHSGIEVEEAENGQVVLNLFSETNFQTDLVLMDVQMPIMDGITATRKLREDLHVSVPIVGITADATRETRTDGLEAGMNEVFFKPVDIATVMRSLRRSKPDQSVR